jgi:hypothetical protein
MSKPIPKRSRKFDSRPVSEAQLKIATPQDEEKTKENSWAKFYKARDLSRLWIGVDLSLNSVAVAGLGYDGVLDKHKGPSFSFTRWNKNDHYFKRLKEVSKVYDLICDVAAEMRLLVDLKQTTIIVEEPWPFGLIKTGNSNALKQQAEMSGAMLSGLIRYGYDDIFQINSKTWQAMVAADLGITTHFSKWGKGLEGKMRPKQWALNPDSAFLGFFPNEVPAFPDLIHDSKNGGNMPKPETSKAKPLQPDDRYDALAIATYGFLKLPAG